MSGCHFIHGLTKTFLNVKFASARLHEDNGRSWKRSSGTTVKNLHARMYFKNMPKRFFDIQSPLSDPDLPLNSKAVDPKSLTSYSASINKDHIFRQSIIWLLLRFFIAFIFSLT